VRVDPTLLHTRRLRHSGGSEADDIDGSDSRASSTRGALTGLVRESYVDAFDGVARRTSWLLGNAFVFGDDVELLTGSSGANTTDSGAGVDADGEYESGVAYDGTVRDAARDASAGAATLNSVAGVFGETELSMLRALGPDYVGDFRLDATRLPAVEADAHARCLSLDRAAAVVWRLRATVVVAFSARSGVVAHRVRVPSTIAVGSPTLLTPCATQPVPRGVRVARVERHVVRECLDLVGGVIALLLFVVHAADDVRRIGALRVLRGTLYGVDGARAMRAFVAARGHELLARAARRGKWPLDTPLLGELFAMAGASVVGVRDGDRVALVRCVAACWCRWTVCARQADERARGAAHTAALAAVATGAFCCARAVVEEVCWRWGDDDVVGDRAQSGGVGSATARTPRGQCARAAIGARVDSAAARHAERCTATLVRALGDDRDRQLCVRVVVLPHDTCSCCCGA
jgi:hypothetical protein